MHTVAISVWMITSIVEIFPKLTTFDYNNRLSGDSETKQREKGNNNRQKYSKYTSIFIDLEINRLPTKIFKILRIKLIKSEFLCHKLFIA